MKSYVCDVCGFVITNPFVARMREFCFTFDNADIYQVPEKTKIKEKIHLCNDCFEGFKAIAKEKARRQKGGAE